LQAAISSLAGQISAPEMQQMNYLVEGELQDPKEVAHQFLQAKHLL
jgi:osmoprotectant transport system substrate-binding protein